MYECWYAGMRSMNVEGFMLLIDFLTLANDLFMISFLYVLIDNKHIRFSRRAFTTPPATTNNIQTHLNVCYANNLSEKLWYRWCAIAHIYRMYKSMSFVKY